MPFRTRTVTTTVGVIGAVSLATLVGCSSDQPTVAPPAAKTDLTNTSWSGPCSGTGLGAFTLQFGAGNTDGGMVKILFPDATTVKTVPYTLKSNDSGHTAFTIALEPPWKGTLQRDYQNLEMSYVVGDEPGGHHCSLVRQGTSGTS